MVVHGLPHLRLAVAPGLPVTLLSGAGAATYGGCGWWRALMALGAGANPDMLDCGDAPGRALEALSVGCTLLVLDPAVSAWNLVAARAAAVGAVLLATRPPALDLADPRAPRRLLHWLGGDSADAVG